MKKVLIMTLLVLTVGLTACGSSNDLVETTVEIEVTENEEQETTIADAENAESDGEVSGIDLSIYPSANIADFEANGAEIFTYNQLFAKIESSVAESGKQEISEAEYYKDANGNDLLLIFYENGEVTNARFFEYYEDGTMKNEIYTDGIGDALAYQVTEYDVNGQYIRRANQAERGGEEFIANTIYDYHANGNLAQENRYDGDVLDSTETYTENGSLLSSIGYEDGLEDYRTDYIYDEEEKLIKVEEYDEGELDTWMLHEYDANGHKTKINTFSKYFPEDTPYRYSFIETYDNGSIKKEMIYLLDEGMFFEAGSEASEEMYGLTREVEYYENGATKKEIDYEDEYLENGSIADKYIIEWDESGMTISFTYYDKDGNVIEQ